MRATTGPGACDRLQVAAIPVMSHALALNVPEQVALVADFLVAASGQA